MSSVETVDNEKLKYHFGMGTKFEEKLKNEIKEPKKNLFPS